MANYSAKEIMLFNPWDNRYNLMGRNLNRKNLISFFYNDFFIKIPEFKEEQKHLTKCITPKSDYFKHFNIISGYSGNGKTTFVNWFKKEIEKNNAFFKIINLIEDAHGYNHKKSLIIKSIQRDLEKKLLNTLSLELIIKNSNVFYKYFPKNAWEALNIFYQIEKKDIVSIVDLINQLSFQQILILYFLEYIIIFKNNSYTSFSFCFDNLDELEYEYMTKDVWRDFLNISSIMNNICQDSDINIDFDFINKVSFILVFREANIAVANSQLDDRVAPIINNRRFILSKSARNILERRTKYIYESDNVVYTDDNLRNIINIIKSETYTDYVFLPLFNFDYRKLLNAIVDLSLGVFNKNNNFPLILTDEYEYYNKIPVESINGARGIIIHGLLKYLDINNHLLKYAKKEDADNRDNGYCRSSRLLLTAISNLSYPSGFPKQIDKLLAKKPESIGLFTLYHETKKIISPDKLIFWLKEFFNIKNSSWAHMVTIYGKHVKEDELRFSDELILLKKDELNNKEIQSLNNTEISLNASAYIYLRYLIVHFEYFSIFATHDNGFNHYKPLFQELSFNTKKLKYGFESLIEIVLKKLLFYKNNMEKYLSSSILSSMTIEQFSKSIFNFRSTRETIKQFYLSRIVMTHIEYLESFRFFLWENNDFRKDVERNCELFPASKGFNAIQYFLLNKMKEYLSLLDGDIEYPGISNIVIQIKNKIKQNEDFGIEQNQWIRIEI